MNIVAQWLNDRRWAKNMIRARRIRRKLIYSRRVRFDEECRPITGQHLRVAYPDGLYHITAEDIARALKLANHSMGEF